MRFEDDFDDNGGGTPVLLMALGVSAFILVVLGTVIYVNKKNSKPPRNYQVAIEEQATDAGEAEYEVEGPKLRAEDLDIWDMYPEERVEEYESDGLDITPTPTPSPSVTPMTDDEKYDDGKHFKIELSDGSSEWIAIDNKRSLNTYDFTNAVINDSKMKYSVDGKITSFVGIDVSRYQKDIDYAQVKNAGIQFVMIRVGSRGYQTGVLALDEYFERNIKAATEAGLDVGVYFYSQAINVAEATEEAKLVVQALQGYKLTYPVAFVMEPVENDIARIDTLTKDERSMITATFVNTVASSGYKTLIYGDEEWLVKKIDLTKMPTIPVWLEDESGMPDYPYQYSMLRYATDGSVYGISGDVNMDICFIDYTAQ